MQEDRAVVQENNILPLMCLPSHWWSPWYNTSNAPLIDETGIKPFEQLILW